MKNKAIDWLWKLIIDRISPSINGPFYRLRIRGCIIDLDSESGRRCRQGCDWSWQSIKQNTGRWFESAMKCGQYDRLAHKPEHAGLHLRRVQIRKITTASTLCAVTRELTGHKHIIFNIRQFVRFWHICYSMHSFFGYWVQVQLYAVQ